MLRHAPLQTFEYFSRVGCAAQFVCFITDGESCFRLCFLCTDTEAIALVGSDFKIFPLQFQNVTDAQSSKASEKRSCFEYGYITGSGCKLFDFLQCKIFLFYILRFNLIQEVVDVLAKPLIAVEMGRSECLSCLAFNRYSRKRLHKSTFTSPKVHLPLTKL